MKQPLLTGDVNIIYMKTVAEEYEIRHKGMSIRPFKWATQWLTYASRIMAVVFKMSSVLFHSSTRFTKQPYCLWKQTLWVQEVLPI
jgi:hypothetical protein